jgi:hypothetical protein
MLFRYPEFVEAVNKAYDERISSALNAEKVNKTIDEYEAMLRPSLRMNHVKWVVFHTINDLVEDIFQGTTDQYLDYTITAVKKFISDRFDYIDSAYGKYHPVLTYSTAQGQTWTKEYTGGCMTDAKNSVSRLKMNIDSEYFDGNIIYGGYINSTDTDFVNAGEELSGGRLHGLYMDLTGDLYDYYSIEYRVYVNGKWSEWERDGALAGGETASGGYITRIQARLLEIKEYEGLKGDADGDGNVNLIDMFLLKTYLAGNATGSFSTVNADMNGDGNVNIADLMLLKQTLI